MWLNQTVQNNTNSNKTTLSVTNSKIDCAKECPCGVPTIPVPDQWLEVMVTGGFKVWHIIFIIIAVIVTTIVIYCCIHRCRIPRTKQEIEADLMRSNLGTKFRDYLQELPNEPLTFSEALKKVQEIEEKLEQDDAQMSRELGARKRMGWIKLKGKDKDGANKEKDKDKDRDTDKLQQPEEDGAKKEEEAPSDAGQANGIIQPAADTTPAPPANGTATRTTNQNGKLSADNGRLKAPGEGALQSDPVAPAPEREAKKENNNNNTSSSSRQQRSNGKSESEVGGVEGDKPSTKAPTTSASKGRRRQKPNLSRTKLAKERPLMVESSDNLERPADRPSHLELPDPTTRRNHKKKLKSDRNRPNEPDTLEHKDDH